MPWYRCLMRGENFPKRMAPDDAIALLGFYTSRWVQAASPEEAEKAVLAMLREDPSFARPEDFSGPVSAKVYFEEIAAVAGPQTQGGTSWFPMFEGETP